MQQNRTSVFGNKNGLQGRKSITVVTIDISAGEILNLFFIISLVYFTLTFTTFLVFSGKKFYSHNVSHSPLRCINGQKYYYSLHAMRTKDKKKPNEPLSLNEDLTFYVWPHLMIILCMTWTKNLSDVVIHWHKHIILFKQY